ncbi:MAG: pentapeptide repeat-containing protein, partial [Nitrospirota bacterium]|nr:pentapeptide repeat-containing protein [Nitrospirota bacterium]
DWVYSEGSRGERADLSGRDLSQMDLSDAVLDKARMVRTNLSGTDLSGASLRGTDLTWSNLKGARLSNADMREARLPDVDLTGARLRNADLSNADLEGADLRGADIDGILVDGADLSGALFDATHAGDAAMDAAYEAEEVYDLGDDGEPVSELPDADEAEEAAWTPPPPRMAPAPAATPAAEPVALPEHLLWRSRVQFVAGGHPDFSGADVRGLSLRDADLRQARHLPQSALAGTDLTGALLPEALGRFAGIAEMAALAVHARHVFIALMMGCLYTVIALVDGRGRPAFALMGIADGGFFAPGAWFYVLTPYLLLAGYLWLHLYLQRLWETMAALPAVFPDGTPVPRSGGGWLVAGIGWWHIPALARLRPRMAGLQAGLASLFAWVAVPAALALFWGAFSIHASPVAGAAHGLAAAAAFGYGIHTYLVCRSTLRGR